jgi:hypothetical protein
MGVFLNKFSIKILVPLTVAHTAGLFTMMPCLNIALIKKQL